MDNLKLVIAKNLNTLRTESGMTQLELANTLNYSDKAVSKWERGESVPDVAVLKKIADLFNVTVDFLLCDDHTEPEVQCAVISKPDKKRTNHMIVLSLAVILVWFVATLGFIITDYVTKNTPVSMMAFMYAVPVSMIVWLVFNSLWFNNRSNYAIISLLMWSTLLSVFLNLLIFTPAPWTMFLLGIPGQIAIFLWSRFQ